MSVRHLCFSWLSIFAMTRLPLESPVHTACESMCVMTIGKVVKVFFIGDEKITDSKVYLEKCVDNYSRALANVVGVRSIIKVLEIVKGTFS